MSGVTSSVRSHLHSIGVVALSLLLLVAAFAACGGSDGSVLPAVRFDAFDLDAERSRTGCPLSLSLEPRVVATGQERALRLFANGNGVVWWGDGPLKGDPGGPVREWRIPGEPGSDEAVQVVAKAVAVWVDKNALYVSNDGEAIERRAVVGPSNFGSVPNGTAVRALIADDQQLFALLATEPCFEAGCTEAPGFELARRPLGSSIWTELDSSDVHLAPSQSKGDIALDDNDVYFVARSAQPGGAVAIRSVGKMGGSVRTLFETKATTLLDAGSADADDAGIADAGIAPSCALPDVCVDGELSVHAGKVYWLGTGVIYAMPVGGGTPTAVLAGEAFSVVAFALDGDFLYANERRGGRVELVRHSLSKSKEDEVLLSQPSVLAAGESRRLPFAVGPNAIYAATDRFPLEIIGICKP